MVKNFAKNATDPEIVNQIGSIVSLNLNLNKTRFVEEMKKEHMTPFFDQG